MPSPFNGRSSAAMGEMKRVSNITIVLLSVLLTATLMELREHRKLKTNWSSKVATITHPISRPHLVQGIDNSGITNSQLEQKSEYSSALTQPHGATVPFEPTGDLRGCETKCAKVYIERMSHVSEKAHRNVKTALCGAHLEGRKLWKSDFPLLLGAGHGSTGTRALSAMTALLGLYTLHFDMLMWPGQYPIVHRDKFTPNLKNLTRTMMAIRDSDEDWHHLAGTVDYSVLVGIEALYDTPYTEFLVETLETFPNASIVLTVRDPKEWRKSRLKQRNPRMPYPHPCGDYLYDNPAEQVYKAYDATNDYIRCIVPEDRFTEVNHVEDSHQEVWTKLIKLMERRGKVSPHAYEIASRCELPFYFMGNFSCALEPPSVVDPASIS